MEIAPQRQAACFGVRALVKSDLITLLEEARDRSRCEMA
jgi:hypothetical protein